MYYIHFTEQLNVTKSIWGPLIPANMKGKHTAEKDKARNQFLACLFLAGASKQNETALTDLNNDYIQQGNKNAYPLDILAAWQFLANRCIDGASCNERRRGLPGVNDVQQDSFCTCASKYFYWKRCVETPNSIGKSAHRSL